MSREWFSEFCTVSPPKRPQIWGLDFGSGFGSNFGSDFGSDLGVPIICLFMDRSASTLIWVSVSSPLSGPGNRTECRVEWLTEPGDAVLEARCLA